MFISFLNSNNLDPWIFKYICPQFLALLLHVVYVTVYWQKKNKELINKECLLERIHNFLKKSWLRFVSEVFMNVMHFELNFEGVRDMEGWGWG